MPKVNLNMRLHAQLIRMLMDGDRTCQELAEELGFAYTTVRKYTRELYRVGALHIAGWEKDSLGRDNARIYKLGKGKDRPRTKMSCAERSTRARRKKQMARLLNLLPRVPRNPHKGAPLESNP